MPGRDAETEATEPESSDSPRKRSGDEEVRRLMLDAAREIVDEGGGLTVSLERFGFEEVARRAGVSRSTAYRAWGSKDQFDLELLRDLIGPNWHGTGAFDQKTMELASQTVAENLDMLKTVEGRRQLLLELIRVGAKRNFDTITASTQWRNYVALTATVISTGRNRPEFRDDLRQTLGDSETHYVGVMASFYADLSVILGFRLKRPHTEFTRLASMGAAIAEGLALRQIIAPEFVEQTVVIDHGDGPKEWSLPALGFLAVLEQLVEMTPDYDPEGALIEYLKRVSSRPPSA